MAAKISDEKLQEKIGFEPFKAQQEIINSTASEKVVVCGRRFGKTEVASYLALRSLLATGKRIWVVCPSYQLTQRIYGRVLNWMALMFPPSSYTAKTKPFPEIELASGSKMEGKSADSPNQMLGEEVDLIIVDEAALIPRNIWEQYLLPATHDRAGKTVFISTPRGRNWLWEMWRKSDGAFQYESRDRPSFTEEQWERAKASVPEQLFNQEYRAMFVDAAGTVFYTETINDLIDDSAFENPKKDHFYFLGADFAKHNDDFVITVVDEYTKKVVYTESEGLASYPRQMDRVQAVAEAYNNATVTIDSGGVGEPVYDELFDRGLMVEDFKFTKNSKRKLVDRLRMFMEDKVLTLPNHKEMIDQLKSYRMEVTDTGNYTYSAPRGMKDDFVDSLALAIWPMDKRASPVSYKNKLKDELNRSKKPTNESFV